jgi:hypothetical protein
MAGGMGISAREGGVGGRVLRVGLALAVAGAFCALVGWGIDWGVPSERRAKMEGGLEAIREVPEELIRQSWRHWGSRGRRTKPAEAFPRHLFNTLRSYHPDEYQVFKSLSNMSPGRLDFDPGNYIYPSLHTYVTGLALGVGWVVGAVELERDMGFYFEHPDAMGRLYVAGRLLTLAAAAGVLVWVWRLGGGWLGLLAMGLLAAMPGWMVHSHNLTRDAWAALAVVGLFACARQVARTGARRWYELSGLAAGVCVAFQYFAAVAWVMVPVAGVVARREYRQKWRTVVGRSVLSLCLVVVVFAVLCPYHVVHAGQFLADFRSETGHVGVGELWSRLSPIRLGGHWFGMLPALVSWPLAVVVCLGVVLSVARHEADDWLLLAWLVVWAAVVGFDGRSYSRYYVPLLPCVALLSARGLRDGVTALREVVERRWLRGAIAAAVLAGVFVVPVGLSVGWAELYARPNVRTTAGEWIAGHVPEGARLGMSKWPWQFEMPPLDPGRYRFVVLEDSPRGEPHDLERLRRLRPGWFVTSSLQYGRIRRDGEIRCPADEFWYALLVAQRGYGIAWEHREPLRLFGRPVETAGYPEDLRYVNPAVVVLERKAAAATEAVAARPSGDRP